MKENYKKIFLIILIFSLTIISIYYIEKEHQDIDSILEHISDSSLSFNYESGIYDKTLNIIIQKNIEIPIGAKIYYTLNGDDPTIDSNKYRFRIKLIKTDDVKVYPLKVVFYYKGQYSDIYEKTYVIGDNIKDKIDIDIISLTTDSSNLYDYNKGIFVSGYCGDNKILGSVNLGEIYSNSLQRGGDWIKPSHITLIQNDGKILINQNVGMEVSGNTSSLDVVKSFKIHTLDNNKIELELCNNQTDSLTSLVSSFNKIKLRAGSQDNGIGNNIRSSVASILSMQSGFDGCNYTRRAVVFLDGGFYGIYDIQNGYSESYLRNKYLLEDKECIEKISSSDIELMRDTELDKLFTLDLNDETNRELLEQKVDMDNYLLYFALEILMNNTEWPANNMKAWRYTGDYDVNNKYTDGRYRFLIIDMDFMYYPRENTEVFLDLIGDNFRCLMEQINRGNNISFINAMKSKYYRDKFITIISDLLNTSFETENILNIIDEQYGLIKDEIRLFYEQDTADRYDTQYELMKKEVILRKKEVEDVIEEYFNVNEKYELILNVSEGTHVFWNNMNSFAKENYTNSYYRGTEFTIKAEPYPGYEFLYWKVNDEIVNGYILKIQNELIDSNGKIKIDAVSKKKDEAKIIISEVSATGGSDWIRITNVGTKPIDISNLYISEDINNLTKSKLPKIVLQSDETIKLSCKNNYEASLGEYICDFNIKESETIYISDGNNIYEQIKVPKMSKNESYGRYLNSNTFKFFAK